ncbi:MAG: hypothetical protein Q4F84_10840 [Fibrobacter sp.]|nr:hypothetical protein [Fibrobacter sp.]
MSSGLIILLFTFAFQCFASLSDPFPGGYSMGNLGTIICKNNASGMQPWTPASQADQTPGWGVSVGAISYYSKGDNLSGKSIYKVIGGGWYNTAFMSLKMSISQLDALGIYYEQSLFCSAGKQFFSLLDISIEAWVHKSGLHSDSNQSHTIGEIGGSIRVPLNVVSLTFAIEHCVIKRSSTYGVNPPLTIKTGVHTKLNKFGAQGVLLEITPDYTKPIRLIIGEEIRILKWLGIHGAIGNNPVMIGIGLVVDWRNFDVNTALVNHTVLGWSKGFSASFKRLSQK